ncbi:DUF2007 domain-containing protein, partial [Dysosmobacter welbionis]
RSHSTMKAPPMRQVTRPSRMPCAPPLAMLVRFMPAPRQKPTKGSRMVPAGARKSDRSLSMLPRIIPTRMGPIAATRAMKGISARPPMPIAIMVSMGPS